MTLAFLLFQVIKVYKTLVSVSYNFIALIGNGGVSFIVHFYKKSAAFNAIYFICCLHFSLLPFTPSIGHTKFCSLDGLQSGGRSERHLLEIRRNFDFVPIPVSFWYFAMSRKACSRQYFLPPKSTVSVILAMFCTPQNLEILLLFHSAKSRWNLSRLEQARLLQMQHHAQCATMGHPLLHRNAFPFWAHCGRSLSLTLESKQIATRDARFTSEPQPNIRPSRCIWKRLNGCKKCIKTRPKPFPWLIVILQNPIGFISFYDWRKGRLEHTYYMKNPRASFFGSKTNTLSFEYWVDPDITLFWFIFS